MTEADATLRFPSTPPRQHGSRSTRIHFNPDEDPSPSKPLPQIRHRAASALARNAPASSHSFSGRRVNSVDVPNANARVLGRRSVGHASASSPTRDNASGSSQGGDMAFSVFSDEFDLAHEDPQILLDIQRAMKAKARRETRLKAEQTIYSPSNSPQKSTGNTPASIFSQPSYPFPAQPTPPDARHEIDFSPSTSVAMSRATVKMAPHPVPTSSDDGLTLDWSGYQSEDERLERRWTLSTSKKKGKEKESVIPGTLLEKQVKSYVGKLARYRTVATPHTMRKVNTTVSQLNRRYALLYDSISEQPSHPIPYDAVKIVKWYSKQEDIVRSTLEQAEPFSWLKHLDKRGRHPPRSSWNLTALIMEEYINAEMAAEQRSRSLVPPRADHHGLQQYGDSPTSSEGSHPLPHSPSPFILDSAVSREASASSEGRPVFGVHRDIAYARPSLDSRRSGDSMYTTSLFSGYSAFNPTANATSPASSRLHLREYVSRIGQAPNESDDNSSAKASLHSEDVSRAPTRAHSLERQYHFPATSIKIESPSSVEFLPAVHSPIRSQSPVAEEEEPVSPKPRLVRRATRTSLPSAADRLSTIPEMHQHSQAIDAAAEAQAAAEYELKAVLLRETTANNARIRQLLHRIGNSVKDYHSVQEGLARMLVKADMAECSFIYDVLPSELIDSFGHDPSAIIGATKQRRGYEAVDDIHSRIKRQRAVFRRFIEDNPTTASGRIHQAKGLLKSPIESLLRALEGLEVKGRAISVKAREVKEVLTDLQRVHTTVKQEYNETLSHVSVIYPELSTVAALLESYTDQYQHVWELGMDALTFLLDTVTPFWRTYGKTISLDIQDFLIIPLYRNEFTGEAKSYPIHSLPRRSFRHWVALLVFFWGSIFMVLLQLRAAVESLFSWRMLWLSEWIGGGAGDTGRLIVTLVRPLWWAGIGVQWAAVGFEGVVVLGQAGAVFWWLGWEIGILR